jgi:hypothetical protein
MWRRWCARPRSSALRFNRCRPGNWRSPRPAERAAAARDGSRVRSSKVEQVASTIPLPTASARVLRAHRASQAAEALGAWTGLGRLQPGLYLDGRRGHRAAQFESLLQRTHRQSTRSPHSFPRPAAHVRLSPTCTERASASGDGDPRALAAAMTTDLYSHVMPTALREAADAIDRVFVQPN